jgi:hypothetical protein
VILCFLYLSNFAVAGPQAKSLPENNPLKEETHVKTALAFYAKLSGEWNGSYSLWLRPGTPAQKSDITAQFRSIAKGNYFLMTYTWKQGGKAQEGVFLFGGHGNTATATWGDSFHMVPEPMQCKGELKDGGKKLIIKGSYAMGRGPTWGWRTEFTLWGPNALLMEAYNITPDGVEGLAVKAEMKRAPKKHK